MSHKKNKKSFPLIARINADEELSGDGANQGEKKWREPNEIGRGKNQSPIKARELLLTRSLLQQVSQTADKPICRDRHRSG
jgi:hypothetical protein